MIVKKAYYPHSMPTKIVVELQDGSYRMAALSPFRRLTEADLEPLAFFTAAHGDEIPDYTLKFYHLTKSSDSRLKQLRIDAGLTQTQLAELSGVNIRQIQRIESGSSDIGNVTLSNATALARALGVNTDALLED